RLMNVLAAKGTIAEPGPFGIHSQELDFDKTVGKMMRRDSQYEHLRGIAVSPIPIPYGRGIPVSAGRIEFPFQNSGIRNGQGLLNRGVAQWIGIYILSPIQVDPISLSSGLKSDIPAVDPGNLYRLLLLQAVIHLPLVVFTQTDLVDHISAADREDHRRFRLHTGAHRQGRKQP